MNMRQIVTALASKMAGSVTEAIVINPEARVLVEHQLANPLFDVRFFSYEASNDGGAKQ